MREEIGVKGILTIEVFENNKLVRTIKDENKIVDNAYKIISAVMNGDSSRKISKIVLGDGGIVNSVLQTVNVTDHDLYHRVKSNTVEFQSNTTTKTISYSSLFKFNEGESYLISEAGLFNQYDTMFNRKTFTEFAVNENFHLNIKWDITFSFNDV